MDWGQIIDEAKENGYGDSVVPTGEYDAVIKKAEVRQKSGKKDTLMIKWEILNGPEQGEVVMEFLTLDVNNKGLMGVIHSKLTGAGITENFFRSLKEKYGPLDQNTLDHFRAIAGQLHGNKAVIAVEATQYNGKPKNDVWAQRPITEAPVIESGIGASLASESVSKSNPYAATVNPELPI